MSFSASLRVAERSRSPVGTWQSDMLVCIWSPCPCILYPSVHHSSCICLLSFSWLWHCPASSAGRKGARSQHAQVLESSGMTLFPWRQHYLKAISSPPSDDTDDAYDHADCISKFAILRNMSDKEQQHIMFRTYCPMLSSLPSKIPAMQWSITLQAIILLKHATRHSTHGITWDCKTSCRTPWRSKRVQARNDSQWFSTQTLVHWWFAWVDLQPDSADYGCDFVS